MDDALVREDATGSALRPLPGGFPHGGGAAADFFEVNQNPAIAEPPSIDVAGFDPALDGAGCDPHFSGGDGGLDEPRGSATVNEGADDFGRVPIECAEDAVAVRGGDTGVGAEKGDEGGAGFWGGGRFVGGGHGTPHPTA